MEKQQRDIVRPTDYGLPQISAKQALTPLDMNMPRLYGTRWILCFPLDAAADKLEVYADLKAGLAQTITRIPWISGNVGAEKESSPEHQRIAVVDGSFGVLLKFNDFTSSADRFPSYEELKAAHFPLSKLSTAQLSPLGVMPQDNTPSVMAAQANFIKDGLLLTVCAHHSVCDAIGLSTVLQIWAQMTSSAHNDSSLSSIDPRINDREPLMTGTSGASLDRFPEYLMAPTPPAARADATSHQMAATPFKLPDMTARIFYFSPSSLTFLKTAAAAYSTNDALHALIWRHVTLARMAAGSMSDNGATTLLYAANMRSKVSPPLPHNYTGNASIASVTRHMSAKEMTASDGLIAAAAAIRSSVGKLNEPYRVALLIGLLLSRPNATDFKFAYNGFLGPDMSSTSWAELNVYEMEWGRLGKAEAFRIPGEGADGSMIVLPRVEDGGLEVVVALESRAMESLIADGEFGRWADVWA
jgi:hypothetical protein